MKLEGITNHLWIWYSDETSHSKGTKLDLPQLTLYPEYKPYDWISLTRAGSEEQLLIK